MQSRHILHTFYSKYGVKFQFTTEDRSTINTNSTQSDIDPTKLLELKELLGLEKFQHLINIYCDNSSEYLVTLTESVSNKKFETIHMTAHAMKGSAANMGATGFSEICQEMENEAREKLDGKLDTLLLQITSEHQNVIEFLKGYL